MKVAIIAEQNFNLIDGSTIWLLNVCKLLARLPELDVTLLASHPVTDRVLAQEVPPALRIVDAAEIATRTGLSLTKLEASNLTAVLRRLEQLDAPFARYFVRGESFLAALLEDDAFAPRLIAYAPGVAPDLSRPEPDWLTRARARRTPLVVQSAPGKTILESLFDYPAHVVHVVPPIVFQEHDAVAAVRDTGRTVLCYSGKIDLHYGLDWLIALARDLGQNPGTEVSLIEGKDTWRTRYREFFAAMDQFRADIAGGQLPHVSLVTGVPHAEAKARMAEADFAWCLRHARYDDVVEISTKIVEFCTAGVVPILNDTELNRALFGADYPYLVDTIAENVVARVKTLLSSKGSPGHVFARARIADVAAGFSAETLARRLATAICGQACSTVTVAEQIPAGVQTALTDRPRHILLATHDAKFLRPFLDRIQSEAQIRLTQERWVSTVKPERTPYMPADVDTVFCEWACENTVWHSHNKRPGTKLIVRLHRFEAFRDFPKRINWAAVDALIVVSDHFRDLMVERFGVARESIHVRPQFIDWAELRRPKLAQARYTIGLVGINPFAHKRFDRAMDFMARLRAQDPRFRMVVRSLMPWQIDWVWRNSQEDRERFLAVFSRLRTDPHLAGAVRFDLAGPDMEEWYRSVGVILSSSDSEGCHTSVMEGIASGAYPVVQDWPGAQGLFAPYVHADLTAAIPDLITFSDLPETEAHAARNALSQSMRLHDIESFTRSFFQL